MALSDRFSERASLRKAHMSAMQKFFQEVSAAETAYCKAMKKAGERLQTCLKGLEPATDKKLQPNQKLAEPTESTPLSSILEQVASAICGMAEEHTTSGVAAYNDAVSRLTALSSEYAGSTKKAIDTVSAADKCLRSAQSDLEKSNAAMEKAVLAAHPADGGTSGTGSDPWISELTRQIAADDLVLGLTQHKSKLEGASRSFSESDGSGRSKLLQILVDALSKIRGMTERMHASLSRAHLSVQGMDQTQENASWQQFVEAITIAETEEKSGLWKKCSANALGSTMVERQSHVSRPGMMNLTWNSAFTVLTNFGHVHIFDALPKTVEGENLPRLSALPSVSLDLKECTAAMADNTPTSLKMNICRHSKFFPTKTYLLKLQSEEDVIDWMISLKRLLPQDSVWMQRLQNNERKQNEKYLKHHKTKDGYKERQDSLYSNGSQTSEAEEPIDTSDRKSSKDSGASGPATEKLPEASSGVSTDNKADECGPVQADDAVQRSDDVSKGGA